MRAFKCRCWSESIKKMTYFEGGVITSTVLKDGEHWGIFMTAQGPIYLTGYQATMFYAGFKDKNEREVYEGDIVTAWSEGYCGKFQVKWRDEGGGSPMYILYPAWQNREMWHISVSKEADGQSYDRGLEVIGNIYENPELLEVTTT